MVINVVLVEVGAREEEEEEPRAQGCKQHRDPFTSILATADSNILQAATILSSLGHDRPRVVSQADSEEDDPSSLGNSIPEPHFAS